MSINILYIVSRREAHISFNLIGDPIITDELIVMNRETLCEAIMAWIDVGWDVTITVY